MRPPERALVYAMVDSPIGELLLAGEDGVLALLAFPEATRARRPAPAWRRDTRAWRQAAAQLAAYFAGELRAFNLKLAPEGTAFQCAVWEALRGIPYGGTVSYAEIARRVGRPRAVRAVGAANGANPLPIVVPCHRVIGADGSLTGFGGGLATKRFLLDLERGARAGSGGFSVARARDAHAT